MNLRPLGGNFKNNYFNSIFIIMASSAALLIGKCVQCDLAKTARVIVDRMVLDKYFLMHFKEKTEYFADDPEQKTKQGDIVLIRQLPKPLTLKVTHKVDKIVYELGNIIDPITGRCSYGTSYVDDLEKTAEFMGSTLEKEKQLHSPSQ